LLKHILEADPTASPDEAEKLSEVWDEVARSIVGEMLAYARPHMNDLHIDLREEMALELAKLHLWLSRTVAIDRMGGRALAPPISLDNRLAKTKGSSEKGVSDDFEGEGVEGDRRS